MLIINILAWELETYAPQSYMDGWTTQDAEQMILWSGL